MLVTVCPGMRTFAATWGAPDPWWIKKYSLPFAAMHCSVHPCQQRLPCDSILHENVEISCEGNHYPSGVAGFAGAFEKSAMICQTAFQRQSQQLPLGSHHHNDAHSGSSARKLGRQGLSLRQGQQLAHAQQMLLNNNIVPLPPAAADILHTTDLRCGAGCYPAQRPRQIRST